MADQSPAVNALPFQTPVARLAREGLQLSKSLDELSMQEVSRILNLYHTTGDLQTRLGQTDLATFSDSVHSIKRMNDPRLGTYTRFWGAGDAWYRGQSGSPSLLDGGLSGDPLSLVTVRPAFSGEPWMLMGDTNAVRKARATGGSLPVGLPTTGQPTVVVNAGLSRSICQFESSEGTQASAWYVHGGLPLTGTGTAYLPAPVLSDIAGTSGSGVDMALQVDPAIVPGAYWSCMAIDRPLDLSVFDGGAATTDDDIIHLSVRMDIPANVEEVRVYFVCSPFTTGTPLPAVPGTSTQFNLSAYLHSYRPSDYAAFVGQFSSAVSAQQAVRSTELLSGAGSLITTESQPGANIWTEFGIVGLPVRRGDFLRIGAAGTAGTDWSTVTGIYVVVVTTTNQTVNVALDDCYITGGYGPDTSEPGSTPYDYRTVNYDPRTGARSNGSAVLATAQWVDALRQSITVTPTGVPADANLRQELYRRGGTLTDNWRYVTVNTVNGGTLTDTLTDLAIAATDVVPIDHFQPVATVDANGTTVLAQPLPVFFGPFDDGTVCALGDPYRPGHLYACIAGEVDHWPSTGSYAVEVCSPAEELMNGCVSGGAGFVLSRERGYTVHTNLTGGTGIVVTPTTCTPGLATRWGFCTGPGGIYYVARDDIRVTNGGDSLVLSDALWPLFHNQAVNGYFPIDFGFPEYIRLAIHDMDLWFTYQDTQAVRQCLIFSLAFRYWRRYSFARPVGMVYSDDTKDAQAAQGALQLLLGSTNGHAYTYAGFTDDGVAIDWSLRTGAWNWGTPREEKLLGDLIVEADLAGSILTAQTFLNLEATTIPAQAVTGSVGTRRYTFDPFGTTPQHAKSVSVQLSGTAPATDGVHLLWAGLAYATQPEVTMNRATTWEPLNQDHGEAYLTGCWIDCDTGGTPRTILVEGLLNGTPVAVTTLTVSSAHGRRLWCSWAAKHVDMVRLRPSGDCQPWMLFGCGWLFTPEPPRIAVWDSGFETLGDSYYTGLDLEIDTFNQPKTLVLTVDGNLVLSQSVTANGRQYVHLTIPPGRGHIYRFYATDTNLGLLYTHKWLVEDEPEEQTHWNAAYTVYNSLSDKYLKGLIIEADTFGMDKTVSVEVDGVVLATVTPVNHPGRTVQNYTFPQVLGRVFRIIPTDSYPSRLYTVQPLFDEEPFALARWESQLLDFNLDASGWGSIFSADVTLKSTAVVTFAIQVYDAQGRLLQTVSGVDATTGTAGIVSTGGAKQKRYIAFPANKGVLFKLVFTSADGSAVTLYKEEGRLRVQPWSGSRALTKPFGNDDLDLTREMTKAAVAAGRQGGAAR